MNNPLLPLLAVCTVLTLGPTAHAGLIHAYNFSPDAPLADDAGGLKLTAEGDVVFSPEGFATFDGNGGHLFAEALNTASQIYTVSFWFRSDDYINQENGAGLVASTSENSYAKGNWGVELKRNVIRFGGKTLEDGLVIHPLLDKPEPGFWHLVTLKFNGTEGSGAWVNEGVLTAFAVFKAPEPDIPLSFSDIRQLILGSDTQGKTGFSGDIADIRIYDDVEWDDAKQAATFQAGPALGRSTAPAAP